MKKNILLLSILLLLYLASSAQTIYFYKLTKKRVNGVVSENVSGGQFLTIIKNGNECYESDKDGFSVGHGKMIYERTENNGTRIYLGDNYYGKGTIVMFKSDFSRFDIRTDNEDIYVYTRATPPSGATTCSLIRKPEEPTPLPVPPIPYPNPNPNPNPNLLPLPNPNPNPDPKPDPKPRTLEYECPVCHGSGKCLPPYAASGAYPSFCFGSGICNNCNGEGVKDGHKCTYCNGSGRCKMCGGTGKCKTCGGKGKIVH